jgi:glycosyltransferase involved in cell wall biosynthesis
MKPRIVLSGVSLNEMGPLMVFRDAIASLAAEYSDLYEIIALVHRKTLFSVPGVTFMEYPEVKPSWWKRVYFEYYRCRAISADLKPHLWFSMDNTTPNIKAAVKGVYCHNPSPFYSFTIKEALLDWKFGLFTLFFSFLYGINIKSNNFVVVQQDWLRREFKARYGVGNVVVAHPSVDHIPIEAGVSSGEPNRPYRFFYPAYPRTFKNLEQILNAARLLEQDGFDRFEVWITTNGSETPYAARMRRQYSDLVTVRWMGLQPRSEVLRLYGEADCLLFPSKLETWGMPITEFKATGKPILVADLPYAHETVGEYSKAAFFKVGDNTALAAMMSGAARGEGGFVPQTEQQIAEPFSRNWIELWRILLADSTSS